MTHQWPLWLMSCCLICSSVARADDEPMCNSVTITISGALPRAARGVFEVSAAEAEQLSTADRPIASLDLASIGYPSETLYLRFSRTGEDSWSVEHVLPGNSQRDLLQVRDSTGPLMFDGDGAKLSRITMEVRPDRVPDAKAGDRLFIEFDDISQADRSSTLQASRLRSHASVCAKPAEVTWGPDAPDYEATRIKHYSENDGQARMLADGPPRR